MKRAVSKAKVQVAPSEFGVELEVPITAIEPSPSNPRKEFDGASLQSLAASIYHQEQVHHILVRKLPAGSRYQYRIIDGERRWRSIRGSGRRRIRVVVVDVPTRAKKLGVPEEQYEYELSLTANCQRLDLTPLEKARAMQKLRMQYGRTDAEIARFFGVSEHWVMRMIALTGMDPSVQKMLEQQKLPHTSVLALLRLPPADQAREAALAVKRGLSLKEIRHRVNRLSQRGVQREGVRGRKPHDDYRQLLSLIRRNNRELRIWLDTTPAAFERMLASRERDERRDLVRSLAQVVTGYGTLVKKVSAVIG